MVLPCPPRLIVTATTFVPMCPFPQLQLCTSAPPHHCRCASIRDSVPRGTCTCATVPMFAVAPMQLGTFVLLHLCPCAHDRACTDADLHVCTITWPDQPIRCLGRLRPLSAFRAAASAARVAVLSA